MMMLIVNGQQKMRPMTLFLGVRDNGNIRFRYKIHKSKATTTTTTINDNDNGTRHGHEGGRRSLSLSRTLTMPPSAPPRPPLLPPALLSAAALFSLLALSALPMIRRDAAPPTPIGPPPIDPRPGPPPPGPEEALGDRPRRLSEHSAAASEHDHDLEHVLSLASRRPEDAFAEGGDPLRVLFIVTTLAEYDRGTRGTTHGAE